MPEPEQFGEVRSHFVHWGNAICDIVNLLRESFEVGRALWLELPYGFHHLLLLGARLVLSVRTFQTCGFANEHSEVLFWSVEVCWSVWEMTHVLLACHNSASSKVYALVIAVTKDLDIQTFMMFQIVQCLIPVLEQLSLLTGLARCSGWPWEQDRPLALPEMACSQDSTRAG